MKTSRSHQLLVLNAIFDLARRDVSATALLVVRETALPFATVHRALRELDAAGLVDRTRVRLTFHGLTVTVASRAVGQLRAALPRAA